MQQSFFIVFWAMLLSNGMGMELISGIEVAGLSATVECWLVATPFIKPPCYWNHILLIQTQKNWVIISFLRPGKQDHLIILTPIL